MEAIGQINAYVCERPECKGRIVFTINLNTGTTPFCIKCRLCNEGMATSSMYRLRNLAGEITCRLAWYRPTVEEFYRLSAEVQEHVLIGGLILGELRYVFPMLQTAEDDEMLKSSDPEAWLRFAAAAYKPPMPIFQGIIDRLSAVGDARKASKGKT